MTTIDLDTVGKENVAEEPRVAELNFARFLAQLTAHYFEMPPELLGVAILRVAVKVDEEGENRLDVNITVPQDFFPAKEIEADR